MNEEALKQEAKEYLRRQTQLNGGGMFHCNVLNLILGFAEPREKRIAELEKENAELKEKQTWLGRSTMCWFSNSPCRSCDEHDEHLRRLGLCYIGQLTKAKEYIKLLLMDCVGVYESTGKTVAEIQAEAEQFIKEE